MYYMNQGGYKKEPSWQSKSDARLEKWIKQKKEEKRRSDERRIFVQKEGIHMKTRNILTANEIIKRGIDPQISINVPKGVETNELEFVIIRLLYFMTSNYAEVNKISFEEALEQYGKAIITQIGVMRDVSKG